MSSPATVTVPAVGGTTPASTRMVVDLPAPLRPSRAVACPAYAWRSMPATASTSPKRTCRPCTSTTGWFTREVSQRSRVLFCENVKFFARVSAGWVAATYRAVAGHGPGGRTFMGWHRMREHEPQAGDSASGHPAAQPGSAETGADSVFWASPVGQAARAKLRGGPLLPDRARRLGARRRTPSPRRPAADAGRGTPDDLLGQIEELGWHLEHVAWWPIDPRRPAAQLTRHGRGRRARPRRLPVHSVPEVRAGGGGAHAAPQ